ncbi:MAG: hypothetical protein E6J56_04615 [Deltaproteobacteria bacterium]|nr:MAG: hypothetical protein E6J56_04615 [Deltaproteobacteria bacterium]
MARSAAPDAVEAIQRQLRRVRRRRNLRELQRAIYLLIAVVAAAMAGLVLLALRASPGAFAEGAVAAGGIALFAAVGVLWRGHRRWVARQGAPRWIDRETRLGGRLVTLVEIHRRGEVAAPLFPLLVEQNVARLSVWHPDRVVPRRVPRGALAAAGSAVALLGIVVALGPRLVPPPPVVGAERPPGGIEPVDLTADRLALAPANGDDDAAETSNEESAAARLQEGIRRALAPAPTDEPPGSGGAAASDGGAEESPGGIEPVDLTADRLALAPANGDDDATETSNEESAAARLQEGIRRALAPAPTDEPPGSGGAAASDGGAEESRPAPGELAARGDEAGNESSDRGARVAAEPRDDAQGHGLLEQPHDGDDDAGRADGAASGAGRDLDPNLFGAPSAPGSGPNERFALSLAARVHARAGGPGGSGDPSAPPVARPPAGLAPGQRAAAAMPRMPVPAAYEAVVRALFARESPP